MFSEKAIFTYVKRPHVLKVKLADSRRLLHNDRYIRKGRQSSEKVAGRPAHTVTQHDIKHRVLNAETKLFACAVCKVCI